MKKHIMINGKIFEENYLILETYSLNRLKNLGIIPEVIERLQAKNLINLENDNYNKPTIETMDDVELLTDFYLGTILNKDLTEKEVKENIIQVGLPKEFLQYAEMFNTYNPLLKWKNHLLLSHITDDNEIYVEYINEPLDSDIEFNLFNLTSKE